MDKLRFISLGSGSSGNCYYLGTLSQGLLIDAGVGIRTLKKRLNDAGLGLELVWGVLITHDHIDHIKSVGVLAEKHHLPIYATTEVYRGIARNPRLGDCTITSPRYVIKDEPIEVGAFSVTAFSVSHDATDSVGYSIVFNNRRLTLATDLGYVCSNADRYLRQSNYVVIEANYDEHMLATGYYPRYLKDRIACNTGHLSNEAAASFLSEIYTPNLSHIYLCHLSKENNTPERAYATVQQQLAAKGIMAGVNVQLHALPRTEPSPLFELG